MINKKLLPRIATATAVASMMLVPFPAKAARVMGGLDLKQVCLYQTATAYVEPVLVGNKDAYSWRCRIYMFPTKLFLNWGDYSIDMNAACKRAYPGSYASTNNSRDPYSWRCYK